MRSATGLCAGGASIFRRGSGRCSAWRCTNARLASNWQRSAFGDCRCARATRRPTRAPKRRSKKLPDSVSGSPSRSSEGQAARDLVARVSRARKQSGGLFSRRRPGSASRARSLGSGLRAEPDPAPCGTPATSGPIFSARSAPDAAWPQASCFPTPTPRR